MTAIEFRNDDAGYLDWIAQHHAGYVLNRDKRHADRYLVLHTARCRQISMPRECDDAYTGQKYIKVCADAIEPLEAHAQAHGGRLYRCRVCNP